MNQGNCGYKNQVVFTVHTVYVCMYGMYNFNNRTHTNVMQHVFFSCACTCVIVLNKQKISGFLQPSTRASIIVIVFNHLHSITSMCTNHPYTHIHPCGWTKYIHIDRHERYTLTTVRLECTSMVHACKCAMTMLAFKHTVPSICSCVFQYSLCVCIYSSFIMCTYAFNTITHSIVSIYYTHHNI